MNVYCSNCERSVDGTNAEGQCPSCAGDDINFSPAFMARWEKAEWRKTARDSTGCPIFGGSTSTIPFIASLPWAEQSLARIRAVVLQWLDEHDASEFPVSLEPLLELTLMRNVPGDAARTLLAGAAALLKDKLTPDTGQLRTQWDRDVDEWMVAAAPLFFDATYQPAPGAGLNHIISCYGCGTIIGYSDVMTGAQDGAICGNCAVTRPERAALTDIADIVRTALDVSDLSKLDLPRILKLCGEGER